MFALKDKLGLPTWFANTPAGKQIIEEREAEISGQRQHALEVLKTIEAERDATMPKLTAATAGARKKLADAKALVQTAQRELAVYEVNELSAHNTFERDIDVQRSFLRDSAPECVSQYLAELITLYSDSRRSNTVSPDIFPNQHGYDISLIERQRKQLNERWEHSQTIREYFELLRNTITLVRRMLTEPWSEADAAREIEAHKRCILKSQKAAGITLN